MGLILFNFFLGRLVYNWTLDGILVDFEVFRLVDTIIQSIFKLLFIVFLLYCVYINRKVVFRALQVGKVVFPNRLIF